MEKITVTAKIDGGTHPTYGPIVKGQSYSIAPEDFGAELFDRPEGFESPHEKTDRLRKEAGKADGVPSVPEVPSVPTSEAPSKKGGK